MLKSIKTNILTVGLSIVILAVIFQFVRNMSAVVSAAPLTPPVTPPVVTPTPGNNAPRILPVGNSLPRGHVNKNYNGQVRVIDRDGDKVKVVIKGLPANLSYSCSVQNKTTTGCAITGKPSKKGSYTVVVKADDKRGGTAQKSYLLQVVN